MTKENLKIILLTLLILACTFPNYEPDYGIGLDTSYMWGLGHLFQNDFSFFKNMIYPIGPLGILKYTVAVEHQFMYSMIFGLIAKFIIVFLGICYGKLLHKSVLFSAILFFILSLLLYFDAILIGACFMSILFFVEQGKPKHIALATLITTAALLIKSSIGISCASILFVGFVIRFYTEKDKKKGIINSGIAFIIPFIIYAILFQQLFAFPIQLFQTFKIASGYSSALNLAVENDFLLIALLWGTILFVPFYLKEKRVFWVFCLSIFPFFAFWKHAVGRQDINHYYQLEFIIFLYWGLVFLVSQKQKNILFVLFLICFSSLLLNAQKIPDYANRKVDINGITHCNNNMLHYNNANGLAKYYSYQNIQGNVLPIEIREKIGEKTIDFYPWELSYVPANNLNWKPRTTLQSGSYSSWMDGESAKNFTHENGPEFILWHLQNDKYGGNMGDYDNRFILNNEPKTVLEIFKNYKIDTITDKFVLLRKGQNKVEKINKKANSEKWNTWIKIDPSNESILRAKIEIKSGLMHKLKCFFYRDGLYFIDYKFSNGKILTYRFNPSNALDGLWIDPFIQNIKYNSTYNELKAIRLRNTNRGLLSREFELSWEIVSSDFSSSWNKSNFLLSKTPFQTQQNYTCTFDGKPSLNIELGNSTVTNETNLSGRKSNKITPNYGQSAHISLPIDSLFKNKDTVLCRVSCWVFSKNKTMGELKLKIENSANNGELNFAISDMFGNNFPSNDWNYIFIEKQLIRSQLQGGNLHFFITNFDNKDPIFADDFEICISY
jgi:hypothetical protein